MNTRAIVFRQANAPALEELPLPDLAAGEILVRIRFSGVSIGTESSIYSGVRTHNGTFPLAPGYMASGVVERLGPEGSGFDPGDPVICMGARLEGEVNSIWGGHSSLQVVQAGGCLRVPEGVSMAEAAMYVMPGVGLNAVNMAGITLSDTVLIQGQGLIGQLCGQWCRNRGARVIAVEPDATRRELAREYVTDDVLDPSVDDVPARVAELTGGEGPSVVIEATAASGNIASASALTRFGGKFIFLSWYLDDINLTFAHFHNRQITAYFPTGAGGMDAARATLDALARGSIRLGRNLTDIYPWDRAVEGYHRLIAGDRSIMGMVVDWSAA